MDTPLMQTPLAQVPFAAIDFESAGAVSGETDVPIQVGIVRVECLTATPVFYTSYLACERPVRRSASRLHGITSAQLHNAPKMLSLWPVFRRMLAGCVVVGHNPSTEQRFLRVFPAHGFGPWLDTLALARYCMPGVEGLALGAVCEFLGIVEQVNTLVPGRKWHDALYDAAAALEVLRTVVYALQLGERPLSTLNFAVKFPREIPW